jgi:hypothetical protein
MKHFFLFLLIIFIFLGCTPKVIPQAVEMAETIVIEDITSLPNETAINIELMTHRPILELQQSIRTEEIVFFPYEMVINDNVKFIFRENGTILFGDKVFVFKNDGERSPIHESLITRYSKNNLLGLNIMEQTYFGGIISYTHIFNIAIKEEISFDKDEYFRFWNFFTIENNFILVSAEKAYAFNSLTGELLWTQTYKQRDGIRITPSDDHFIIEDVDGNIYKIFGDGRKEVLL